MFSSEPYTFDRVVRLVLSLLLTVAVIYFVYVLRDVLLPWWRALWLIYLSRLCSIIVVYCG